MRPGLLLVAALMLVNCVSKVYGGDEFRNLQCNSILSDRLVISSRGGLLTLFWKVRGGARLLPLLKQFASKQIPDSLLSEYDFLDIEMSFPLSQCSFSANNPAEFSCATNRAVAVKIDAKLGAYDNDPHGHVDRYSGILENGRLQSRFFVLNRAMMYGIRFSTAASGRPILLDTDAFYAQGNSADGRWFDPDCRVDGEYVVKK